MKSSEFQSSLAASEAPGANMRPSRLRTAYNYLHTAALLGCVLFAGCGGAIEESQPQATGVANAGKAHLLSASASTVTTARLFTAAEKIHPFTFPTHSNCEQRAVDNAGRPLFGASKQSFIKACVADKSGGTRTWSNLLYAGLLLDVQGYANDNYLAVANNGRVYGLGPYTNGVLVDFGELQSFAEQVCGAIRC